MMDTKAKPSRIYLKTPEQQWLRRGGLAAFSLPLLCVILFTGFSFFGASTGATRNDLLGIVTLSVVPLTGALFAAFLATREIRKKNQHGFKGKLSFVWIGVKVGFIVHWTIALLFFVVIWVSGGAMSFGDSLVILAKTLAMGGYVTLLLWGFITLPLSFAGGFVFWFVAVRGSDNLMAEVFD